MIRELYRGELFASDCAIRHRVLLRLRSATNHRISRLLGQFRAASGAEECCKFSIAQIPLSFLCGDQIRGHDESEVDAL